MTLERPKRAKVLLLTQYLHFGGLERMILNLSMALKGLGCEPSVFVYDSIPNAGPENDLAPAFREEGIGVMACPKRRGFSISTVFRILRKLRSDRIRVLHTHDLGPLIYGVCVKLLSLGRIRLIHTQHSFVHLSRRSIYPLYERLFTLFADEITVVSEDTRDSYVRLGVAPRKLHVIPNGVRFSGRSEPLSVGARRSRRSALHESLDAGSREAIGPLLECHWLLYMARLHKTKGQGHALRLWRSLDPSVRRNSALLFIGPESEEGQLRLLQDAISAAPDPSRVLYLGIARHPELWIECADIALSCSEFEGLPLGPIEAAGAGIPLVLSEIPGHEALRPWSAMFPLSDPALGARAVETLLARIDASPEDFVRAAWGKARELRSRYGLSNMGRAYARLYSLGSCHEA